MNIVIIGGGKLGYSLAINMLDRDFRVNVIEKNKVRAMNLANELDAEVICGDGTELEVLMKAGVQEADWPGPGQSGGVPAGQKAIPCAKSDYQGQ